jgi:hypothetical protein
MKNSHIEWCDKKCSKCGAIKPLSDFNNDRSRADGRSYVCRACNSTGKPHGLHRRIPINPLTGKPGPAPKRPRDGDAEQARQRINVEVKTGHRPHPNLIACAKCDHEWQEGQRRHEYHHHLGYAPEHHGEVIVLCTVCHAAQHFNPSRERTRNGTFV